MIKTNFLAYTQDELQAILNPDLATDRKCQMLQGVIAFHFDMNLELLKETFTEVLESINSNEGSSSEYVEAALLYTSVVLKNPFFDTQLSKKQTEDIQGCFYLLTNSLDLIQQHKLPQFQQKCLRLILKSLILLKDQKHAKYAVLLQKISQEARKNAVCLAEYYMTLGQTDMALKYVTKAWKNSDLNTYHVAECLFVLARCLLLQNQYLNGVKTFAKSQQIIETLSTDKQKYLRLKA